MEIIFTGAIGDKQNPLPINYELMGGNTELPKTYILNDNYFQDQGLLYETRNYCGPFATTTGVNEMLHKKGSKKKVEGIKLGAYMVSEKLLDPNVGAYGIDVMNCALKLGIINGFTYTPTIEQIKQSIANNNPVFNGSNTCDWKETRKAPFNAVYKENSPGHFFIIVGYDETRFICENSYGNKLYDNGRFYIKFEDFEKISFKYTRYSLFIDDTNFEKLNELIKLAKKWGYKDFYDLYIKNKTGTERMLGMLASQIVFIKKINNKELLELIK